MKEIKKVGIVGFGVMGAAIALNVSVSGYTVVFKELNDELVKSMYDKWVTKALSKRVERGKMTQEAWTRWQVGSLDRVISLPWPTVTWSLKPLWKKYH